MVISQTPLRISFVGGGSDLPSFYKKFGGAVVSTAIDKYIYINVNKKFDDLIRVSYSITEFADKPEVIKHELVREALLSVGIQNGVEITSISDIPSKGTGLGSSSSYTVGVLNALRAYLGKFSSKEYLADKACEIEIEKCHQPIGKQDQYAAAFGGFNFTEFHEDDSVSVSPIICSKDTITKLQKNLLLLYTGITRSTKDILEVQNKNSINSRQAINSLKEMTKLAMKTRDALSGDDLDYFGNILDENWQLKKSLAGGISSGNIDKWYGIAKKHGAVGGKILGAGGGGFLLVYADEERHPEIVNSLPNLKPIDINFDNEGSRIIYYK